MEAIGETAGLFGLYELSDQGAILYSRPRGEEGLRQPTPEFVGHDFFYEVVGCDNTEELRRHFRKFISERRPVDSFLFDCLFDSEVVRTKIFMARAFETDDVSANEIVIVDIRKVRQ